jgi:hypothetical protein
VGLNEKGVNQKLYACMEKKLNVEINQPKNVTPDKKGSKLRSVNWQEA